MKIEELNELKEKVNQLQKARDKVLEIQAEIKKLEETEEIKRYLSLLDLLEEKTTGKNTGIEKYTNKMIINIAIRDAKITPDDEIYVYLGTYKYSNEVDIIHGANDIPVKDIIDFLNKNGYKNSRNKEFNKGSLQNLFKNKKYIGTNTYRRTRIP